MESGDKLMNGSEILNVRNILTVGHLMKVLKSVEDPDTSIVILTDGWYDNLAIVQMPDEEHPSVILEHREPYDSRQA